VRGNANFVSAQIRLVYPYLGRHQDLPGRYLTSSQNGNAAGDASSIKNNA
jgi:hypothetical protein